MDECEWENQEDINEAFEVFAQQHGAAPRM